MENNEQHLNKTSWPIKKGRLWKNILLFSVITTLAVLSWAGWTKAGVIPNFLDLEILCSEDDNEDAYDTPMVKKPVIYLYPEEKQDISVQLDYDGEIFADLPEYDEEIKGWKVTASPNGTLINHADGMEYSYLFWEGIPSEQRNWDLSTGFVVRGEDTKVFLQETLAAMGLTPREYNEFIVYWFPLMQDNPYNLIHFAGEEYTKNAPLTIHPKPDSMLRVFMVYQALEQPIQVQEQKVESFKREGFAVIEWGGTEMK